MDSHGPRIEDRHFEFSGNPFKPIFKRSFGVRDPSKKLPGSISLHSCPIWGQMDPWGPDSYEFL